MILINVMHEVCGEQTFHLKSLIFTVGMSSKSFLLPISGWIQLNKSCRTSNDGRAFFSFVENRNPITSITTKAASQLQQQQHSTKMQAIPLTSFVVFCFLPLLFLFCIKTTAVNSLPHRRVFFNWIHNKATRAQLKLDLCWNRFIFFSLFLSFILLRLLWIDLMNVNQWWRLQCY